MAPLASLPGSATDNALDLNRKNIGRGVDAPKFVNGYDFLRTIENNSVCSYILILQSQWFSCDASVPKSQNGNLFFNSSTQPIPRTIVQL